MKPKDTDTFKRVDELHAYYHKQMWCRKQMFITFKRQNAFFKGVALLLVAIGMVTGTVQKESFIMVALTALSTLLKGWVDFKKFGNKMEMCRFAYTTLEKICIELNNYARGLPLDDLEGFLIKSQVNEETISDLCPVISDQIVRKYDTSFTHVPINVKSSDRSGSVTISLCPQEEQEDVRTVEMSTIQT